MNRDFDRTSQAASDAAVLASFPLFLTILVDAAGQPLEVPAHHVTWAQLLQDEPRLVLRAPRGHGKSTLVLAYLLWRCWGHGRTPRGWTLGEEAGTFDAVLFSATSAQALELMARFRDLLLANERLFGPLLPQEREPARRGTRWSASEIRLSNRARVGIRAYGVSARGMHPDLLLLDDILNDSNSLTMEQRNKTYRYFMSTLMPMHPRQIVVVGTAIHHADLLAHLGDKADRGRDRRHTALGFRAATYRALDEETGEALWPERFPVSVLLALRDEDPLTFSREYQNDPRDDASSLFPYEVTDRAVVAGASLVFGRGRPLEADEVVVLGVDVARSSAARADFTVAIVVAWNARDGTRRVLDIRREKGLELDAQVQLIRDLVVHYHVVFGYIENNGLQQWLIDVLKACADTAGKVFGSHTGHNKADRRSGIPGLAFQFRAGTWVIPSGDPASLRMARIFQAELGAFGFNDRHQLSGVGEHDDTVVAAWLVELAVGEVAAILAAPPRYEIIWAEDIGILPVKIGEDY